MMDLTLFDSPEFGQIRAITEEDSPLFVAKDVATALGYADTVNAIKAHCKGVVKRHLPIRKAKQPKIEASFIPESDLYRLIMRSKLPSAERFQDWVVEDVLPSIRRAGGYSVQPALPGSYLEALEALVSSEKEKRALAERNQELKSHVADLEGCNLQLAAECTRMEKKVEEMRSCVPPALPDKAALPDKEMMANDLLRRLSQINTSTNAGTMAYARLFGIYQKLAGPLATGGGAGETDEERVLRRIREAGPKGLKKREITVGTRALRALRRDAALERLLERGAIRSERRGRKTMFWAA